jgi:hypothetical protein
VVTLRRSCARGEVGAPAPKPSRGCSVLLWDASTQPVKALGARVVQLVFYVPAVTHLLVFFFLNPIYCARGLYPMVHRTYKQVCNLGVVRLKGCVKSRPFLKLRELRNATSPR